MRDAVEHPSEPRQIEDDEEGEWHSRKAEQRSQPLMKSSRRLLGEVNALDRYGKGEQARRRGSLRHPYQEATPPSKDSSKARI